jgi:hypothetical protein
MTMTGTSVKEFNAFLIKSAFQIACSDSMFLEDESSET